MVGKLYYKVKCKLIYKLNSKLIYKWLIKDKYDVEIAFVEGFDTKLVASSNNLKSKKYAWVHTDMIINNHSDLHFKDINAQKNCYRKFNKIFAVSENVKDKFIEKFKINNIEIQYNPVDSKELISKSKNCIKFENNKINLITIGRLESQKGYDRLLRIVKKLRDEDYIFKLYILGDGSLKNVFEKYIKLNNLDDCVELLGFKKNPYEYLISARCFYMFIIF